ncbi:gamma-glutamyl-gamma-aminobutyrate hydrolase family protein [Sporosarcina gallistercoris]|uniref:Gamma-glutamyl-gamma-aminobutyrate hydrolase family protein n=1 Tax=Sporosarcina gallistercoris TaxID=2762245 RepID=A0ABR8PN71_9BACL|nr:gamma-glutamyl-gamma-aminobutyrate hydrolase family protein [Sporosarcina gallistercoris]MBD7909621.1 gamma-glutamyl-gamma-aminobutyrate hydrolase family protein [Sporosarcina gallistercoris]
MKPLIGITSDIDENGETFLKADYSRAILRAGGLPVVLPAGLEDIEEICDRIDGLLLTGGEDVNPLLFGEEPKRELGKIAPERDTMEMALAKCAVGKDMPVLGICRGHQILNVALGGTIHQHIYTDLEGPLLQHKQQADRNYPTHTARVTEGSRLAKFASAKEILVNSLHHQAVNDVPEPLKVIATATDGIIEALESTKHRFVMSVQWHPEALSNRDDETSLNLFEGFVNAASQS